MVQDSYLLQEQDYIQNGPDTSYSDPFATANQSADLNYGPAYGTGNSGTYESATGPAQTQTDSYGNYYDDTQGTWVSPEGYTLNQDGNWVDPVGGGVYDTQTGQWYDPGIAQQELEQALYQPPTYQEAGLTGYNSLTGQEQPYVDQYGGVQPAPGTGNQVLSNEVYNQLDYFNDPNQVDVRPGYYDPGTGIIQNPQNLREQGIATGAIRGDIGNTPLGQGVNYLADQAGQGLSYAVNQVANLPVPDILAGWGSSYYQTGEPGNIGTQPLKSVVTAPSPYPVINETLGQAGRTALEYAPYVTNPLDLAAQQLGLPTGLGATQGIRGGIGQLAGESIYPHNVGEAALYLAPLAPEVARFGKAAVEDAVATVLQRGAAGVDEVRPLVQRLLTQEVGAAGNPDEIRRLAAQGENLFPSAGQSELGQGASDVSRIADLQRQEAEINAQLRPLQVEVQSMWGGNEHTGVYALRGDLTSGEERTANALLDQRDKIQRELAQAQERQGMRNAFANLPEWPKARATEGPGELGQGFTGNREPGVPWSGKAPTGSYDAEAEAAAREQAARISNYDQNIRPGIQGNTPSDAVDNAIKDIAAGTPPEEAAAKVLSDPELQAAREAELGQVLDQSNKSVDDLLAGINSERGPKGLSDITGNAPESSFLNDPYLNLPSTKEEMFAPTKAESDAWQKLLAKTEPAPPPDWARVPTEGSVPFEPGGRIGAPDVSFLQRPDFAPEVQAFNKVVGAGHDITWQDWVNLPRGLMAGTDASLWARQAFPLAGAHPTEWLGMLKTFVNATRSEETAYAVMKDIAENSQWARLGIQGPHLSAWKGGEIMSREEFAAGADFIDRIPGLRNIYTPTTRGNTVALNKFRSDVVDQFIKHRTQDLAGTVNRSALSAEQIAQLKVEAQKYANSVSRATGYGSLGKLERTQAVGVLSQALFSARSGLARPEWVAGLLDKPFSPVWNQNVKDMIGFLGMGSSILYLAHLAGADVSLNPTSTNFGKIVLPGGEHIDIWAGYQQVVRTIAQLASGETTSSSGNVYKTNELQSIGRFLANKLSPQAQLGSYLGAQAVGANGVADFIRPSYTREGVFGISGKVGNPIDQALQFAIPLWIQDVASGMRVDGLKGAGLGALSFIGVGSQTYKTNQTPFGQEISTANKLLNDPNQLAQGMPQDIAGIIAGKDFLDLGSRNKEDVLNLIPQEQRDKWTDAQRKDANEYQTALDQQQAIRDNYAPVFAQFEAMLKDPNVNPYDVKQAIKATDTKMWEDLQKVEFPESKNPREKSDIQNLQKAYRDLYDMAKDANGKVNYDLLGTLQTAFIDDIKKSDPSLGRNLEYNVEKRPDPKDPEILQTLSGLQPLLNEYYSVPPEERTAWRYQNPQEEGLLIAYGQLSTAHTAEAALFAAALNGGRTPPVNIWLYDSLAVPNNSSVPGYREASAELNNGTWKINENDSQEVRLEKIAARNQWLADNPEKNAALTLGGQVGSVYSMEAYNLVMAGK